MPIIGLALKSLWNRKFTALLTVFAIALSVTLLLGVERLRTEARASFAGTISGTDLVVGARSGSIQLLLYSVFRIGSATNNISWESYQDLLRHPRIARAIPVSLGDSYRGYPVMGTTHDYFEHYRFGRDRRLELADGRIFEDLFDAVLGADVAERLGYPVGAEIVVAHGAGRVSFIHHDDKPFQVTGILKRTGTPVDRTVHIRLEGMEAIHVDWVGGAAPRPRARITADEVLTMDLTPKTITAVLLGLDLRTAIFQVQRFVNEYRHEPLLAILPGVALQELWDLIGVAERALRVVSGFVVLVGLVGMLTAILASLEERRREMAILRSVGARPLHVFFLFAAESVLLTAVGMLLGLAMLYGALIVAQPLIAERYGLFMAIGMPGLYDFTILGVVLLAALVIGLIPGYRAYRYSLADGLTVRV